MIEEATKAALKSHKKASGSNTRIRNRKTVELFCGIWRFAFAIFLGLSVGCYSNRPSNRTVSPTRPALTSASRSVLKKEHTINDLNLTLKPIVPGHFTLQPSPRVNSRGMMFLISQPFLIAETEITNRQYEAIMDFVPSRFADDRYAPVERVSWLEATQFCRLLTQRERDAGRLPDGIEYRLPTTAEWVFCDVVGRTQGYNKHNISMYAWFDSTRTHTVALKEPNSLGLYDLPGNVAEWCYDFHWGGSYFGTIAASNIFVDPVRMQSLAGRPLRSIQGGSWRHSSKQQGWQMSYGAHPMTRSNMVGFRIVLGVPIGALCPLESAYRSEFEDVMKSLPPLHQGSRF